MLHILKDSCRLLAKFTVKVKLDWIKGVDNIDEYAAKKT